MFASESGVKRDEGRGGPGFGNDALTHGDHLRGLQRPTLDDCQRNARLFVRDALEPVVPAAGVQLELEVKADYASGIRLRGVLDPGSRTRYGDSMRSCPELYFGEADVGFFLRNADRF